MKKHAIWLALSLGILVPQRAQNTPQQPEHLKQARHSLAVGLLRSINTAEVTYHSEYGSYAAWQNLARRKPRYFDMKLIARSNPQLAEQRVADEPEILPGWSLRLNVHADDKGYDVLLQDMTDKQCWYAAYTNESGLIRQSKAIDCEIDCEK